MANNNHFELTLDTLAPIGSITRPEHYLNANANGAIVKGDATFMKVWFNTNAVGTKSDVGYTGGNWVAADTSYTTEFVTDGVYYYHLVLMDDVANESEVYNTQAIVFDTTAPDFLDDPLIHDPDSSSTTITNNLNGNVFTLAFEELYPASVVLSGSDINTITITDLSPYQSHTPGAEDVYNFEYAFDFKSGTVDGLKSVTITVTDEAGNSYADTAEIYLDTAISTPVLVLLDQDEHTLPDYINYHGIKAEITSADTDIVGYKVWEDGTTEPAYTSQTKGSLDAIVQLTLTSGDGLKTVHAKVLDSAGNEKAANDATVTIDTVNPVVSISSDKSIISNVSGFNTAVLTLSGTDALSGVDSYDLKCGATTISSGSTVPASFNLTSANSMVEGNNTITLHVVDNAGNENSANVVVILDTTASTASITDLNTWYNAQFNIQANYSDANNVEEIYAWTSLTADDTTVPSGTAKVDATTSPQTIANSSINWALQQNAANYMHIKVVDEVGNVSYAHKVFGYDNVAPTSTITFTAEAYPSVSANVNISYSDATSGVVQMKLWGDITAASTEGAATWENIASSKSVTLNTGDGMKTIHIKVKDAAGNVQETAATAQCELDTTTPVGIINLRKPDDSAAKESPSPVAEFNARIGCTDDNLGTIQYKLYGDFTYDAQAAQGITEANAQWQDLVPETGETYMLIEDMFCTEGDGTKTIYIKVKDNAGNVSEAVAAQFVYDTTEPTVTVSNIDYNRLSKVHELRRNSSGTIAGKYADQTNFTFTPNEAIQAYKVCAYENQAAAEAGDHTDDPIPSTNGSVNMSATGLNSEAAVNAMIKGADYEIALGGVSTTHEHDGAHIVVVYVQDMGGVWSVAAEFEVSSSPSQLISFNVFPQGGVSQLYQAESGMT